MLTWGLQRASKAGSDLNGNLAKARSLGLATTKEEAKRNPAVPKEQNAAPLLSRAETLFDAASKGLSEDAKRGLDSSVLLNRDPNQWKAAVAALPKLVEARKVLDQATKLPHADFGPLAFEEGSTKSTNQVLGGIGSAEVAAATDAAERGQFDEAAACYHRILQLGKLAGEEYTKTAYTLHLGSQRKVLSSLKRALYVDPISAERRAFIVKTVEAIGPVPDIREAMRHQLAADLIQAESRLPSQGKQSPILDLMSKAQRGNLVTHYVEAYEKLPKDPEDYKAVRNALSVFGKRTRRVGGSTPYMFYANQIGATVATRHILLTACEILANPAQDPQKIIQSMKTNGLDPFTGNPLVYAKTDKGFKLYSLGENGKDDQGDTKKDVVLEVNLP